MVTSYQSSHSQHWEKDTELITAKQMANCTKDEATMSATGQGMSNKISERKKLKG